MGWSDKYKKSIDCNNPKGFSQRAHCQGRKKKMNEEKGNGRCKPGHYYCYTNKECRPIPAGFMVDPQGMLRKENGHTVDEGTLHKWFKGSKSTDGKGSWEKEQSKKQDADLRTLESVCVQHEIDHLNGVVCMDRKVNTTIVKDKKVGRNEPCPCGSGKKYKKCCIGK